MTGTSYLLKALLLFKSEYMSIHLLPRPAWYAHCPVFFSASCLSKFYPLFKIQFSFCLIYKAFLTISARIITHSSPDSCSSCLHAICVCVCVCVCMPPSSLYAIVIRWEVVTFIWHIRVHCKRFRFLVKAPYGCLKVP